MDLRKILENDRHLCKKVVIFWKNITALKVCWLGVEKLVFLGYLGGGRCQGHFDFHPMGSGIAKVAATCSPRYCWPF